MANWDISKYVGTDVELMNKLSEKLGYYKGEIDGEVHSSGLYYWDAESQFWRGYGDNLKVIFDSESALSDNSVEDESGRIKWED